jgi:hypothetical protein
MYFLCLAIYFLSFDIAECALNVQDALAAVSEQLRRYVDEHFLEEERRINQIMKSILSSAIALRNAPRLAVWAVPCLCGCKLTLTAGPAIICNAGSRCGKQRWWREVLLY